MIFNLTLICFTVNPWMSIHHYQHLRHPYQKNYVNLVTESTPAHLTHVIYGFMPHWRGAYTTDLRLDHLTHLAWFGIELDSGGKLEEAHGWPSDWDQLRMDVQRTGTRFDLTVTCFDWSGNKIHDLLSIPENRMRAISTILEESEGCDGVNIDFERPGSEDRELFTGFIGELADSLHKKDMELSVDVTAVNWGDRIDAAAIANAADHIFIMGYDYHWSGSSKSGPVAPLEGETYNVTHSVNYYIEETQNRPERIVLGVPYYGYDWPTETEEPYSSTEGSGTAYIYTSAATRGETHGIQWHETTSTPWYPYVDDGNTRQCWFEDTLGLGLKYTLAKDNNLAGIGIWALTYDAGRQELWNLLAEHFSTGDIVQGITIRESLDVPGIYTAWKLRKFLRKNPEFEVYDTGGRRLDKPQRGVVFVKGRGTVSRVILIR